LQAGVRMDILVRLLIRPAGRSPICLVTYRKGENDYGFN
jgi:hypothetical protein